MPFHKRHLRTAARKLVKSKNGAAAIEFALVAPLLIAVLIGIINFGYTFYALNSVQNIAVGTSRSFAYGALSKTGAEAAAENLLRKFGESFRVNISETSTANITVTVMADPEDLELIPFPGVSLSSWYRDGETFDVVYETPAYRLASVGAR